MFISIYLDELELGLPRAIPLSCSARSSCASCTFGIHSGGNGKGSSGSSIDSNKLRAGKNLAEHSDIWRCNYSSCFTGEWEVWLCASGLGNLTSHYVIVPRDEHSNVQSTITLGTYLISY